jgi:4-hydroxybenzoate polyprenyltransferase
MAAIGWWLRYGAVYYAGLAVAAAIAVLHYRWIRTRTREGCFRAFLHNNWLGAAVFGAIVLERADWDRLIAYFTP